MCAVFNSYSGYFLMSPLSWSIVDIWSPISIIFVLFLHQCSCTNEPILLPIKISSLVFRDSVQTQLFFGNRVMTVDPILNQPNKSPFFRVVDIFCANFKSMISPLFIGLISPVQGVVIPVSYTHLTLTTTPYV